MTDLFTPPPPAVIVLPQDPDLRPLATPAMRGMHARLSQAEDTDPIGILEAVLAVAPRLEVPEEPLVRDGLAWLDEVGTPMQGVASPRIRRHEARARALAAFLRLALGEPARG